MREVSIFSHRLELGQAFKSARGEVLSKETFLFLATEPGESLFKCLELPLSPSMGLLPAELHSMVGAGGMVSHPLLVNLCTWFALTPALLRAMPRASPSERVEFRTIGIGEMLPSEFSGILKLKGSPENLDQLIEASTQFTSQKIRWSVDFNGSLKREEFRRWLALTDLVMCEWIEQPLAPGVANLELLKPYRVFLDEEMNALDIAGFERSGASGFVLKPWRHSLPEYLEWHAWAHQRRVPYVVGSMIQSSVADELCDMLNEFAPIRYRATGAPLVCERILEKAEFIGKMRY